MAPNISKMDKFKTYTKAGAIGAIGGAAGGAAQAMASQMRMPSVGRDVANSINQSASGNALSVGQNTLVDSSIKGIAPSFAGAPNLSSQDAFATESLLPASGMNGKMMSSPGGTINEMTENAAGFDSGRAIMNNLDTQKQFLNQQQKQINGFENLPTDKQMRFNEGVMTQVNNNPNAAGNMLNAINSKDRIGDNYDF